MISLAPCDRASDSESEGGGASGNASGAEVSGSDDDAASESSDDDEGSDDDSSLASEDLEGEIEDVDVAELGGGRPGSPGEGATSDSEPAVIVEGKRRRFAVDYKALNLEMFGDFGSPVVDEGMEGVDDDDEDEVWSPRVQALKAKRQRRKKKDEEEDKDDEEADDEEDGEEEAEEEGDEEAGEEGSEEGGDNGSGEGVVNEDAGDAAE